MPAAVLWPVLNWPLGLCAAAGMGSFLATLFLLCLRPEDKENLRQALARLSAAWAGRNR